MMQSAALSLPMVIKQTKQTIVLMIAALVECPVIQEFMLVMRPCLVIVVAGPSMFSQHRPDCLQSTPVWDTDHWLWVFTPQEDL